MHFRLLATNIPPHITSEEFYDSLRAHTSGDAVVNALLITLPANQGVANQDARNGTEKSQRGEEGLFISSGTALIDYETKAAADAARRVNFLVEDNVVMLGVVGLVAASGQRAAEKVGRNSYQDLRYGLRSEQSNDTEAGRKRCRTAAEADTHEMELRLVGIPTRVYGKFLGDIDESGQNRESNSGEESYGLANYAPNNACIKGARTTVGLFFDVSHAIRRATMGELLSLRRVCDDEAVVTVPVATGTQLLEMASDGHDLCVVVASGEEAKSSWKVADEGQCYSYRVSMHKPRAQVMLNGENLLLVRKHDVLRSMASLMEQTNAKVAGFVDPFGNVLIPRHTPVGERERNN